jgi:hypothetical protein
MKKFVVAMLALTIGSAFAAEVQIMNADLPYVVARDTFAETRFQMDSRSGEGSVVVTVNEWRDTGYGDGGNYDPNGGGWFPNPNRMAVIIMKKSVKVEGLALHGDQVIYAGEEGDVNCGRLGKSPVLNRPTIYLTGNCKLNGTIVGNGRDAQVNVTMTTK